LTYRHRLLSARVSISILAVATILVMAAPALAATVDIAVGAPDKVLVGQDVEVKAVLSEDGVPIEGAEVALTYQASLGGESTRVEIATGTTDETGTAVMFYEQRADDNGEMQVTYLGPGTNPVSPYVFTIAVEPGGEQLYRSESGVEIPFVNGTLVILLITGVWSLIALAAVYLVRVGREGRLEEVLSADDGSVWISVLLAIVAVITAIGMVIVFVRVPVLNTDLTDPEVYDRTQIAYIGATYPYQGFGLDEEPSAQSGDPAFDGGKVYFGYGCAACHGVLGQGAVVGPTLEDEIGSLAQFIDDIREGPRDMPAYGEATLTEADIEKIYRFLDEGG